MPIRLGRRLLACSLAFLAFLAVPSVASPAGMIVLFGSPTGSHLRLTTEGEKLIATGAMASTPPDGCRFTHGHSVAACSLAGAEAIELVMGPAADFVDVEDPMPVTVTAHLGGGSDKMIGNSERDICYSEGARRNRCVGGGGNDVCITGNQNSDCVGGPGNDVCITGDGSDGCWGGPGNDVCKMGPGDDGCHGEGGDDRLYGGPGADQLYGGSGWDYCDGGPGEGQSHECEAGPGH